MNDAQGAPFESGDPAPISCAAWDGIPTPERDRVADPPDFGAGVPQPVAPPRLTTSRLLILMIPLSAYFAAFAQMTRRQYVHLGYQECEVHPVGVALELV